MKQQATTETTVIKLIEFRQAMYENGMLKRQDVLFDLLDALMSERAVVSFTRLSQSEKFLRKWPSLYNVIDDGDLSLSYLWT